MKNPKELVIALRIAIVIFALAGGVFYGYAVPFVIPMQRTWDYILYIGCSIPCFVILILAWEVTCQFAKGLFFAKRAANDIRVAAWILSLDCLFFVLGNAIKWAFYKNGLEFFFIFFGVAGLCLSVLFFAIGRYIRAALAIKEENEAIV
jgi:branched-subunit amino acid transport protein AzlD